MIAAQEEVVTLRRKIVASRQESKLLSAENARFTLAVSLTIAESQRLAFIVNQTSEVISRVKSNMFEVRAELEAFRQLAISCQGPMIKASLYKLVRT